MSIYFQYNKIVSKCLKENTFKILPEKFGEIAFAFLYSKTDYLISVSCLFWVVLFCLNCCKYKPELHLCILAICLLTISVPVPYIEGHVFKLWKMWLFADTSVGTTLACLFLVYRTESTCWWEHYRTVEGFSPWRTCYSVCPPQPSTLDTVVPIRHAEARSHKCLLKLSKHLCLKQIQVVPMLLKAWQHFLRTV